VVAREAAEKARRGMVEELERDIAGTIEV
jgi:hypothetical protein